MRKGFQNFQFDSYRIFFWLLHVLVVVMEMQYLFCDIVIFKHLDDSKALEFKWSVLSRWKSLQQ